MPPFLELRHIGKSFAGVRALDGVSLAIGAGTLHCLAGENGSGKSTLIKIISGVTRPDQGEILFEGQPQHALSPARAIARGVQVIFQDFAVFGNLTVAENLALSSELRDGRRLVNWRRVRAVATQAVARLGVDLDVDADVERLPTSGRQLVAIARALMSDARLLIMDEPTTALTRREVETLFRIVRDIGARGIAVLFVSHKMREMLEISEHITVLRNGSVAASGATADFDEAAITRAMTGQDIAATPYRWRGQAGVPRLDVRGLAVPGRFEPLDLSVQPGEIVGIAGLLGSGRTDVALTLFGMHPSYHGGIAIDGIQRRIGSVQEAIGCGIAYVPEDRLTEGLFPAQSIARNLLAGSLGRFARAGLLDLARAGDAALAMIRSLQIATPSAERPVMELSGGNQQRVVLGRWLLTQARLLVLNGPTVGVDVGSKSGIHRTLRALAVERGLAILMISDDGPELVQNCNRILVMHRGRMVDELDAEEMTEAALGERLRGLA